MMVQSIDHITINVKNLEASRAFYGELLGLAELSKVDMGDHVLTYYALPGGVKLELISYMSDTGDCTASLLERGRFRHLALRVDDLETLAARLGDFGGRVLQPPRWVEQLGFTGMLAEDPNGCELEFLT